MHYRAHMPLDPGRLPELLRGLDDALSEHGIDPTLRADVRLITEEVACNIVEHGVSLDAGAGQHLQVAVTRAGERLQLEFRDIGPPFDPLSLPPPDLGADIAERPVGGLGVHLIRTLAERNDYAREEPYNVLRLTLRLPAAD